MKASRYLTLFIASSLFGAGLGQLHGDETVEVRKDEVRAMQFSILKKQYQHNLKEIEKLKAELQRQNELYDDEIAELKALILSQEEKIIELEQQH